MCMFLQSELDEALRQNKDMSEELEGAREAVIRLDAIEAKEEVSCPSETQTPGYGYNRAPR